MSHSLNAHVRQRAFQLLPATLEREGAKPRTYDTMLRKAKAGHVTGGKVFGYDNREVRSATGHRVHVLRVINPHEAAIVRQIYEMHAGGLGMTRYCQASQCGKRPRASSKSPRVGSQRRA